MEVAASQINYSSSHTLQQKTVHKERFNFWSGNFLPTIEDQEKRIFQPATGDRFNFSGKSRQNYGGTVADRTFLSSGKASGLDPRLQAMRTILEFLTGRRIQISEFSPQGGRLAEPVYQGPDKNQEVPEPAGWGLEYDYVNSYKECEEIQISAQGLIKTADGQERSFNLTLDMNREFYQSTEIHLRLGDARLVDPLVINFDGKSAELTDSSFLFDLDADGKKEEIAGLARGSGFLAIDKNEDGAINDGSELFGPQSGHGFSELARYDQDGNGWLDENDPIWTRLAAWIRDQAGNDRLINFTGLDIGALHLKPVVGEFSLNNQDNQILGRIREHSVFLREKGQGGFIQEIDLRA